jgi:hypothetical protein
MKPRPYRWLGWGMWGVDLASLAAALALVPLNPSKESAVTVISNVAIILTSGLVGALIVSRQPRNAIGWILCLVGFIFALGAAVSEYGEYAFMRGGTLPGGRAAVWFGSWYWAPGIFLPATFLLLLFPDGRPLSRRWRLLPWMAIFALIGIILGLALEPGPLEDATPVIENPFGLSGAPGRLLTTIVPAAWFLILPCIAAGPISLFLRFRRARGDQRQQIKWLAFAGSLTAGALLVAFVIASGDAPSQSAEDTVYGVLLFSIATIPICAGIAILKYRLYDIDLVINRTLVYGALTVMLGSVYIAGVVGLGSLVRSVTGQENNSLVIAASTLAVAALFRPGRRRIQSFIDRRFYRRKYDAVRTLEAFSSRLREQVDLEALTGELLGVVRDTVQPAHVSLWLRSGSPAPERST